MSFNQFNFAMSLTFSAKHPSSSHCKQRCHHWSQPEMSNQKNSIPKCHELSIRCHFYLDFSIKTSEQAPYPNHELKHPMSFLYGFVHEKVKKIDTHISQIKHPMSSLYWFFHENVKKCSVPKCHELSIRCHVYIVCDEKNSFHKTSSSRRTHRVRTILIQPKSKQISCKSLNATTSKMKRSIYSRRSHTPDSQS